jgi:hypothetical protein
VAKTVSIPTVGYKAKTVYVPQTVYEPETTYVDQTVYETQYKWRAVETTPAVVAPPVVAYWHPPQYYAASTRAPAPERVKVAHHRQHRKVVLAAN